MTNFDFDKAAKDWDDRPEHIARTTAIARAMLDTGLLSSEMTALEYGCGTGLLGLHIHPHLRHITLADTSDAMLAVLDDKIRRQSIENMTPLKLDVLQDPLPDERFDLIYTASTLHHIADTERILGIFYGLLKNGGWLFIADLDKEDGSFHGGKSGVHHGFDRGILQDRLTDAGYTHIRFTTCHTIFRQDRNGRTMPYAMFLMTARRG